MYDKSIDIWTNVSKLPTENFRQCMSANYSVVSGFYPHTELRFLDSTKQYKILDFGCGDGRNAQYLRKFASRLDGYDLPGIIQRATGYDNLYSNLEDIGDYDIIISSFVFQFFQSKEYLQHILEVLASKTPFLYVYSRIWMDNGDNLFKLIFENPNWSLELGDGQNLGWLVSLDNTSNAHFEQVYRSKRKIPLVTPHIGFDINQQGQWIYKSYNDCADDIRKWKLPEIAGVAGIPRSGIHLAAMISHWKNIPLYTLENLISGNWFRPNNCRPLSIKDGPILVIDDTCWSGYAMSNTKKFLESSPYQIIYGALYASEHAVHENFINVYGKILPTINHTFEWNLLRDPLTQKYMVDMDGVLCKDWVHTPEMEDDDIYLEHLSRCEPLYKPTFPVYKIVTARLEKYRQQTEKWLRENGVIYNELIMSPYSSRQEREINNGFGPWKAEHYRKDEFAVAFIESSEVQSKEIYQITNKPVFCVDTMQPYGNLHI